MSKEQPKDPCAIIPKTMTTISDTGTESWGMTIKVNRALWRSLSFGEQADINRKLTDLQLHLQEYLETAKIPLTLKLEAKKNASKTD